MMECKNCGGSISEIYCPNCGEKRFDSKELSIGHFLEETFEGLIHFDNKFFRTVWTLFTKPGQLSVDYVRGRRRQFLQPLQFFVVVNLLFYLLMMSNPYSAPLNKYINGTPYKHYYTRQIVDEKLKHNALTLSTYEYIFDDKLNAESKELVLIFIPLYAFMYWVLFFMYHRRFVEHLVFATHFVCLVLCYYLLQSYLIEMPVYLLFKNIDPMVLDTCIKVLIAAVLGTYIGFASRRFYRSRKIWSAVAGVFTGATFFYLILIYRMILFYKILFL